MPNPEPASTPIAEVDFTTVTWVGEKMDTRIRNGLQRAGFRTMAEVIEHTPAEIRAVTQGIGVISMEALKWKLDQMGLSMRKLGQR